MIDVALILEQTDFFTDIYINIVFGIIGNIAKELNHRLDIESISNVWGDQNQQSTGFIQYCWQN